MTLFGITTRKNDRILERGIWVSKLALRNILEEKTPPVQT